MPHRLEHQPRASNLRSLGQRPPHQHHRAVHRRKTTYVQQRTGQRHEHISRESDDHNGAGSDPHRVLFRDHERPRQAIKTERDRTQNARNERQRPLFGLHFRVREGPDNEYRGDR